MSDERFRTIARIRGGGRDMRPFLLAFAVSVICHLALVVVIIFASEYNPEPIPAASVINVSMISFPDEPAGSDSSDLLPASEAPEPDPEPEPAAPELEAEELEQLLMRQENRPEPEPIPEPVVEAPVAPEPESESVQAKPPAPPAEEQVVIDAEEEPEKPVQAEPEPEPPEPARAAEKPALKPPAQTPKPAPENVAAPPRKTARFQKPSRIAKPEVTDRGQSAVKQAIEDIQKRLASRESSGGGGGRGAGGSGGVGTAAMGIQAKMAIKSYAGSVLPDRINRNWAFSDRLTGGRANLEAVLVITISAQGKITDIRFERKSGHRYFDDSVYKAVVKSDPLPPLPKVYTDHENTYTVGLRFTPSGLN